MAAEDIKIKQARMAMAREVRRAKLEARRAAMDKERDSGDGMSTMTHFEPLLSRSEWADDMGDAPLMAGDAQHVVLFSTEDGTPSRVRAEQLVSKLMPDRQGRAWFSEKPINPEWQYRMDPISKMPVKLREVRYKCMLHPDNPDRSWLESIGLAGITCTADNIPSEFQRQQHMRKKHQIEWATIESAQARRREDEDRARQERLLEMMAKR